MTEQQRYQVVARPAGCEVRDYPEHLVAEVEVSGPFADAGNRAFGTLAGFIFGSNQTREKIAMTAPVLQKRTAAPDRPATDAGGERHLVAFVMPAQYTMANLPAPTDSRIRVREVPARTMAARTFPGHWSEARYRRELTELGRAAEAAGLEVVGDPVFARFDPPWKPGFLRRNEVLLPVRALTTASR